ncbi:50S ribosomal protein L11 [Candidatus Woesearchaeota archaeon]|nr:50S ribosomal protein L11 [Candidatus Woesearchaeota archaeon]|tara:strand:- start:35937 stop:36734 length:798 start_codon:yes stop_codon:yes gene_type:complete
MATQTIESMIPGGKASAAPPLGPALGPLGINIGEVIAAINKKTAAFNGMQVPIKVNVETDTKAFEIEVGTPPSSALILKESAIEKGSGNPLEDKIADLKIEQIIKIAKMKEDNLMGKTLKEKVKEIIGSCNSMGVMVEGKQASEVVKDVNAGTFDKEIAEEKTELTAEELKELEEERKKLAAEVEKRKTVHMATAKKIIDSMPGKARGEIKLKLVEAGVPALIINELLPVTGAAGTPGAPGAPAPAEGEAAPASQEAAPEEKKEE